MSGQHKVKYFLELELNRKLKMGDQNINCVLILEVFWQFIQN